MSGARIGLLTIGQSPRGDGLARDVAASIGDATVLERGALDGLSRADIDAMAPGDGDYRLVTLLRDGSAVQIAKRHILARLQAQIDELEAEGVAVTLLMCTGEFPPFRHTRPLVAPQAALYAIVRALAEGGPVASLTPLPTQVAQAARKWASLGVPDAFVTDADPYGSDAIGAVAAGAARARAAGASVLFMDCFGYDVRMRDPARVAFGGTVVLARSMAGRLAAEVGA